MREEEKPFAELCEKGVLSILENIHLGEGRER
jgi:hypothetical protein